MIEMNKEIYNKVYKTLIRRIIIASTLLLLFFFFKQFVTQYQITQEINTAYTINIAGRQRMLSQKLAKDIGFFYGDKLTLENDSYKEELAASLELWKESHRELLELNKRKGFLEKENIIVTQKFQDIEPSFYSIVSGVEGFLREIEKGEEDRDQLDLFVNEVIHNEASFLEQMDSIVYLYDWEATQSLKNMRNTHMVLFILIIGILIFIIFKIFIPLLKYLDNAFRKVSESNKNLIKMFHTIKGALFLIKRDGEILFMNKDSEQIISKGKGDNETLYIDRNVQWVAFHIKNLIEKVKNDDIRIEGVETNIQDKDGNLISVVMSAVSGHYHGHEVVVLNLFDLTTQKKAEEILKNTALKDELTGLYNRHFLESIIDGEIKRAQRHNIPFSAILLDLDHFKKVNDQWGHPVGDSALRFTADIVKENIRESDLAIRIGGEEFLILMPNTDTKGAIATAEKIRRVVETSVHPVIGNFSASFGVAERLDNEEYKHLYKRVDGALYQAKENGRNCVKLAVS